MTTRRRSSDGSSTNEGSRRSDWRGWRPTQGRRARRRRGWARRFERLLVHVDVDVLDYLDFPIAENTRRNQGLRFTQLVDVLRELIAAPNWVALTVCEVNPDHGELDGTTMRTFSEALADVLSAGMHTRR